MRWRITSPVLRLRLIFVLWDAAAWFWNESLINAYGECGWRYCIKRQSRWNGLCLIGLTLRNPRGGLQIWACIYSVLCCLCCMLIWLARDSTDSTYSKSEIYYYVVFDAALILLCFCVFYIIEYAHTLICRCLLVVCFSIRSLSYEWMCMHSMCTYVTIVAICAQWMICVSCELPMVAELW